MATTFEFDSTADAPLSQEGGAFCSPEWQNSAKSSEITLNKAQATTYQAVARRENTIFSITRKRAHMGGRYPFEFSKLAASCNKNACALKQMKYLVQ